jgi:dienelactone hydrolase
VAAGCASKSTPPASLSDAVRTSTTTVDPPAPVDLTPPARVGSLRVSVMSAPGVFVPKAQWLRIERADHVVQYAAVYRPARAGRYPAVLYLHGSTGLEDLEIDWAARLASHGFVVVIGCYLNAPTSNRFVACPSLPSGEPIAPEAVKPAYNALLDVTAALPGVASGKIGVVGVSYGAIAALSLPDARVGAIVGDSGYGKNGASAVHAPVLLLAWSDDDHVAHVSVVAFEMMLQKAHKQVNSQYYPGAGHVPTLAPPPVGTDATTRTVNYLRAHLEYQP